MANNDYKHLINWHSDYTLPTMCVSLWNNKIILTTKKVGSRYFEDLSRTDGGGVDGPVKSIDFRIERVDKNAINDPKYDKRLLWGSHHYFVTNASHYNIDDFLKELGIKKVSDIISDSTLSKRELVIVVRNPIIRTFTAFVEVVDSFYAQLMTIRFVKPIAEKYFKLDTHKKENHGLGDLPEAKVVSILNEYSEHIGKFLVTDEHASGWHQFLFRFITLNNLKSKVTIINLDDKETLKNYPQIHQPSNKKHIKAWLSQEDNLYLKQLISSMNHFLIAELDAYDSLCELINEDNSSELI
jgi:hypothetical protein